MPAEIETLAYVSNEENGRFVPWHRLGTAVSTAMTSEEALKIAGLDWEVNPKPIFTDTGKEIPNYFANTRSSDEKVLGIVSGKYKVIQNKEAFDFTDALIGEGVKYETAGSLCGGKRVFLLARLPEKKILNETFDNYVCFTNSHDGCGSIKVAMTPVRVVCQNTLNLALEKASRTWSARHFTNITDKLEDAKRTLELADTYMEELNKEADKLANITISDSDTLKLIETLFPINDDMSDKRKGSVLKDREAVYYCTFAPDLKNFRNTAYGFINAVSDFATHKNPKRKSETFEENNFRRTIDGNYIIDGAFDLITKGAAY